MSWPRKNETYRLYCDRQKAYCLICVDQEGPRGYDAIANVYNGSEPSLCGTSVSRQWLAQRSIVRVAWDDLPEVWKNAFNVYMNQGNDKDDPSFNPALYRGLWRKGEQLV